MDNNNPRTVAPVSTVLAHGKARLNPLFQKLTVEARNIFDEPIGRGVAAQKWFRGRKTNLLAHLVVGTIDQLLFAALPAKHVVLRHLGLSGKVVIIDELHSSDAWMRTFLKRVLHWLAVYRVPVIGLSATLPPRIRDELIAAYQSGLGVQGEEIRRHDLDPYLYPRITVASKHEVSMTLVPNSGSVKRKTTVFEYLSTSKVDPSAGDLSYLARHIIDNCHGGVVGVVCNTVSKSQELYSAVIEQLHEHQNLEKPRVVLLHSRFPADLRATKEADLVSALGRRIFEKYPGFDGRGRPDFPNGCIVISTQIIEQGLDLDFDLMYSDIAPIDLLVQRIGRLHRHRKLDKLRPSQLRQPKLIITGVVATETDEPEIDAGSVAVYRLLPLLKSLAILRNSENKITSPDDIAHLIVDGDEDNLTHPAAWSDLWQKAIDKESEHLTRQIQYSSKMLLASSDVSVSEWAKSDFMDSEAAGYVTVRDTDDSLEVILVYRDHSGHVCALPHVSELQGIALDGAVDIDNEVAERIARCSVRLPGWMSTDQTILELEKMGMENWQRSSWLSGELVLILDNNLTAKIAGYEVVYDREIGLSVE